MKKNEISIPVEKHILLNGNLKIPFGASSLVVFSHGSGSSRFSTRNNFIAEILNKEKIATLLTDLLTEREDSVFENSFNIDIYDRRNEVTNRKKRIWTSCNWCSISSQYEHMGNYVPSLMAYRYNAFNYLDKTSALHPLYIRFILNLTDIRCLKHFRLAYKILN